MNKRTFLAVLFTGLFSWEGRQKESRFGEREGISYGPAPTPRNTRLASIREKVKANMRLSQYDRDLYLEEFLEVNCRVIGQPVPKRKIIPLV